MSLITDKVFYRALLADSGIVTATDGRIYNTSIPVPDDDLDNEPLPYIIITFDSLQNDGFTKDNSFEGDTDKVAVSITVVAESREELGELSQSVRSQVISFFENYEAPADPTAEDLTSLIPFSYAFTASEIMYEWQKPCFSQTLTYQCDTNP